MAQFIEIIEADETFEHAFGQSVLTLRRYDADLLRQLEQKHSRRQKNFKTGQWTNEVDTYALTDDLVDHVIIDWKGVRSPTTGREVPCTPENKRRLPTRIKIEILEACDAEAINEQAWEDERKN